MTNPKKNITVAARFSFSSAITPIPAKKDAKARNLLDLFLAFLYSSSIINSVFIWLSMEGLDNQKWINKFFSQIVYSRYYYIPKMLFRQEESEVKIVVIQINSTIIQSMWILLFVVNIIFIIYFFIIGVRRLAALPLMVLLAFVFASDAASWSDRHISWVTSVLSIWNISDFVTENALVLAWWCVVFWLYWLIDIYANISDFWSLWLIWAHVALLVGSFFFDYEDGKKIFHVWLALSLILLLYQSLFFLDRWWFIHLVMILCALMFGVYSFLVVVMWSLQKNSPEIMKLLTFILFNISVISLIYVRSRDDLPSAVVLSQIYLMLIYCIIYWVHRYAENLSKHPKVTDETLLQDILDGKRIIWRPVPFVMEGLSDVSDFLHWLDKKTTFSISFINVVLVVIQVYLFVSGFWSESMRFTQWLFWFWVAAFFVNYLLLREIWFYHELQRWVAFLLINFGIYLSIINIYGESIVRTVILGVGWSLVNSLAIFWTKKLDIDSLLEEKDYMFWLSSTAIASLFNVYFILRLPLSVQFRYSFLFLYVWIQIVLFLYTYKFIKEEKNKKPRISDDEVILNKILDM